MKKIILLSLIALSLTLTSCTAVVKTEESIDDVKAEKKEEVKNETPVEEDEEIIEESKEEVKSPEETPDLTKEPEEAPIISEEKNYITPSENETEAIIADFGEVSEEALDAIIEGLTGGEALEFPPVPLN